jgi:hypothetical protein
MAGFTGSGTHISSYYNWSPSPDIPPAASSSLYDVPFPFIPMLWGCNETYTGPFSSAVASNFSNVNLTSDRAVLGFNEPDIAGQSDCTPSQAAQVWREFLEPLRYQGYRLGSPAVTSGSSGKRWMVEWFEACNGSCNPDFITLHWVRALKKRSWSLTTTQYDISAGDFMNHVKNYYQTWNKPIWVTGTSASLSRTSFNVLPGLGPG